MNVLVWHVHGSYTTALVQGGHRYLLPLLPDRGADGRGRADTWDWPASAVEVTPEQLADEDVDVVLAQRPHEVGLAARWLGRQPGRDVALVYLEHSTPGGDVPFTRHPLADRDDVLLVHVTPFNATYWDCGRTRTRVVEHGVPDPGQRWTGELPRAAVLVNDPLRRGRAVGTDLLPGLGASVPLDVYGMRVDGLAAALGTEPGRLETYEDLPQGKVHDEMARRALYLHPYRWTSLGLALVEAMLLGVPVVALAATAVPDAVPAAAGVVSGDPRRLAEGAARLAADPARAADAGAAARAAAVERFALPRFLSDWDDVLQEVTS
jgi:glycosyltransferase involved in cell wall biosynthesis